MQRNHKSPTGTLATTVACTSPVAVLSEEILTVAEVAALLKVPQSSIYEWTRYRGNQRTPIPHRKIGKYIRVLRSELEAWLIGLPKAANTKKRKYVRKADADTHVSTVPVARRRTGRAA